MSTAQPAPTDQKRRLRVFLCHASGDKQFVRDLYARLTADGFDPWLDEKDLLPGQRWQEEIPATVRKSDVVIVCLSRQSVNKEGYLQREIRYALDEAEEKPEGTIFIIPARIEEVAVPKRLSEWQWANLFEDDGYERLIAALTRRASALGLPEGSLLSRALRKESDATISDPSLAPAPINEQILGSDLELKQSRPSLQPQPLPALQSIVDYGPAQNLRPDAATAAKPHQGVLHLSQKKLLYAPHVIMAVITIGMIIHHQMVQVPTAHLELAATPTLSSTQTPSIQPTNQFTNGPGIQLSAEQLYNKGDDHYFGQGVAQDYVQARRWYLKAADAGNANAMYSLGVLYAHAFGVIQDYRKARSWFLKAAAAGDTEAMNYLGDFYENGRGVKKDYQQARSWYERAVAAGNSNAMNDMGFLYDNGHGVAQDYQQARSWYEKAAAAVTALLCTILAFSMNAGKV